MPFLLLVFQIPAAGQLSFPTVEDYDNHQSILSPAKFTSTAPCHPSASSVTQTESTLQWKTKDTLVMKSPLLCCLPLQMLSTTGLLNKRQSLFPSLQLTLRCHSWCDWQEELCLVTTEPLSSTSTGEVMGDPDQSTPLMEKGSQWRYTLLHGSQLILFLLLWK